MLKSSEPHCEGSVNTIRVLNSSLNQTLNARQKQLLLPLLIVLATLLVTVMTPATLWGRPLAVTSFNGTYIH